MSHGVLLITLAAILQAGGAPDSKKAPFVSKEGGFSIAMPGEPTQSAQTTETGQGPMLLKAYQLEDAEGHYTVVCGDLPVVPRPYQLERFFDGVMNGLSRSIGGKILLSKKVLVDGVTAREVKLEVPKGIMYSRCLVKRERLYQIGMLRTAPKPGDDAEFLKFANSFRSAEPVGKLTDGMEPPTTRKVFRSEDGRFNVRIPGEPKETSQKTDPATGKVEPYSLVSILATGGTFDVSYISLPKSRQSMTPAAISKTLVNGAASNMNGKILKQGATMLDGRTAFEAEIGLPEMKWIVDAVCLYRIQRVDDRLYVLTYTGPRSNLESKAVTDFFDSFHLDDPKTPKAEKAPTTGETATPKK